jgi:hypothetical protein
MITIPFTIYRDILYMEARLLQDKNIRAIFDTGAYVSLFIEEKIVRRYKIPMDGMIYQDPVGVEVPSAKIVQLYTGKNNKRGDLLTFKNCFIDMDKYNGVDDKDVKIMIGPTILKYYFTIIDFKRNLIILTPYNSEFNNTIDIADKNTIKPNNTEVTSLLKKLESEYKKYDIECSFKNPRRIYIKITISDERFSEQSFWASLDTGSKESCVSRKFIKSGYFEALRKADTNRLFQKDNRWLTSEKVYCGDYVSTEKEIIIYDIDDKKRDHDALAGWSFFKDSILVLDHNNNKCYAFR